MARPTRCTGWRAGALAFLVIAVATLATGAQPGARAWSQRSLAVCVGDLQAAPVPQRPGPALRFGITPGAVAGQIGLPAAAKPEDPARTMAALRTLAPAGVPFVVRLNRFFSSDGEAGIERFLALAHTYTAAGFLVELQLRYHPAPGAAGDIPAWTSFVREVVRRFGPDRGVVGLQVTNEVNFAGSADSSDGSYPGAKDALIAGVLAAHDEATRRGFGQLRIGFNWFYQTDPISEQAFWTYLGQHGGAPFASAVDWVGLDAYPGTFFPPLDTPGGERDAIVNALSSMRACYLPLASIAPSVAIHVEENGYPTGLGRSEDTQRQLMQGMVGAFYDFRGTFNVSDYRWFNLRDADTGSPSFQQHFGLLHDDYSPKPAFDLYRWLISALSIRASAPAPISRPVSHARRLRHPRMVVILGARTAHGRCRGGVLRIAITGIDRRRVRRVSLRLDNRVLTVIRGAPLRRRMRISGVTLSRARRLRARVLLADGHRLTLSATVHVCRRVRASG